MTTPITQHEVESEILRLSRLAEKVTTELAMRAMDAAEARTAQKVAHAKAYLVAEGTGPTREATAVAETERLLLAREIAEAKERAAQEAGRNYRAQLDSLRSINSNLKFAIANASGVGS